MKKLVISGSSKLHERALYWRGYFEGRGYEVIDWPCPISTEPETTDEAQTAPGLSLGRWLSPSDNDYAERKTKIYQRFYKNLDQADTFFLMNEDKDGIEGYIGSSMIAEITYAVVSNLNRGRKIDINILKMPSKDQNCYEEVKFWLDQNWIKIYQRPTGKKATVPVPDEKPAEHSTPLITSGESPEATDSTEDSSDNKVTEGEIIESTPHKSKLFGKSDKMLDLTTCNKRCLSSLTPEMREYLKVLSPEFPAWLLKYLAAPEMQRLAKVSISCGMDYTNLYQFKHFCSTFAHSLGVALIVWHFTRDKKQTLAALFHDIATPAFKHSIDFMNGDAETQESTEDRTEQIIRNSRVIMKQLKKDGILPSEVTDYHLYPIADNDLPNLAADRLEYTFTDGYFLYDIWTLDDIKSFYNNLTVLKNESGLDELAFQDPDLAADFTTRNLSLAAIYHGEKSRANMQFLADITHSMIVAGYLNMDDLYVMSEREIIDWILSCGDKNLSDVFRQYQRATTVISGNTMKKNCYCVPAGYKIRYIVPLVKTDSGTERITDLDGAVDEAVQSYLNTKQPKYVGFEFDFKPYTE